MQKILKNNRGSITLFVVLSVLFFLIIVTSVAVSLRNKESAVDSYYERVKTAYEKDVGNEKAIYEEKVQQGTVFLPGKEVNAKMKQLAGNSTATYETEDTNITAISRSNSLPDKYKRQDHIVSTSYSASPIYMWFENGTLSYYSSSKKINLNKDSSYMFNNIKAARTIEIADSNTSMPEDRSYLDTSMCEDMSYLFHNCLALTQIDVSIFNTEMVTNMSNMFSGSETNLTTNQDYRMSLTKIDGLTSFNTKNVEDMSKMFFMDINLTTLDVSRFDTAKVKNMNNMFGGYWSNEQYFMKLTSINGIEAFDTSNVENMGNMFYGCEKLTSLDVSGYNTSKVTNMSEMFMHCSTLTELDLSNFNTSNVTNMWRLFRGCNNIISMDLSNFDMTKVTNVTELFSGMSSLTKLITPKIYPSDTTKIITLPKTMYDYGGNEYTELTSTSPTKKELRSTKF